MSLDVMKKAGPVSRDHTVSWFSRKVVALEGHQPMTPGGRPSPSLSLFSSSFCNTTQQSICSKQQTELLTSSARWQSQRVMSACHLEQLCVVEKVTRYSTVKRLVTQHMMSSVACDGRAQ